MRRKLYAALLLLTVTLTALLASACGGSARPSPEAGAVDNADIPAAASSPAELEAQLDALSRPENISPAQWDELKTTLASTLQEQGSLDRTASAYPFKAPRGNPNLTSRLQVRSLTGGRKVFSWEYPMQGDYDQNQLVSAWDLSTIGITYLRNHTNPDWDQYRVADGNRDGGVNNGDILPLAINFNAWFSGCVLEYAVTPDVATWSIKADLPFEASSTVALYAPRRFEAVLESPAKGWYRLRGYNERSGSREYGTPWKAIQLR